MVLELDLLHEELFMPHPVVVYHQITPEKDCAVGILAAWVFSRKYAFLVELIGDCGRSDADYAFPDYHLPFDFADRTVIIIDFSYPSALTNKIREGAKNFTNIPPHAFIKTFNENVALSAWKHNFRNLQAPWFINLWQHCDDADVYCEDENSENEAIIAAINSRRRGLVGFEAFPVFNRLLYEESATLAAEGWPEIKARNRIIQQELDNWDGQTLEINGYSVPFYLIKNEECFEYCSLLGSIASRQQVAPFVASATSRDSEKILLRRRQENATIDCGAIARELGGSGNAQAASFRRNL